MVDPCSSADATSGRQASKQTADRPRLSLASCCHRQHQLWLDDAVIEARWDCCFSSSCINSVIQSHLVLAAHYFATWYVLASALSTWHHNGTTIATLLLKDSYKVAQYISSPESRLLIERLVAQRLHHTLVPGTECI